MSRAFRHEAGTFNCQRLPRRSRASSADWMPGDTFIHTTTDPGNAPVCANCHRNTNPGTPGCFNNTLCHGALVSPHPAGWSAPTVHGPVAKAAPGATSGFQYCQVCHGPFARGGTFNCQTCHGIVAPHPAQTGCLAMPLPIRQQIREMRLYAPIATDRTQELPGALTIPFAMVRWAILILTAGVLRQSTVLWPRLLLEQLPDSSTVRSVTGLSSGAAHLIVKIQVATTFPRHIQSAWRGGVFTHTTTEHWQCAGMRQLP